jgi:hypothetical protein
MRPRRLRRAKVFSCSFPFSRRSTLDKQRGLNLVASRRGSVPLETSLEDIGDVGFTGHDGEPTTVSRALPATSTDAFIVLRRGRIAAEWYGNGMSATTPHIVFSVSKSICGALGGILAERGLLDPDAPVIEVCPRTQVVGLCRLHRAPSPGHGGRHRLQRGL